MSNLLEGPFKETLLCDLGTKGRKKSPVRGGIWTHDHWIMRWVLYLWARIPAQHHVNRYYLII